MEVLRKYGVATDIYVPLIKRAVVDFAVSADWTPAAGDVKISKDGAAAANITTLPTAITMGNGAIWKFPLSATEMQAAKIAITVADSATKAVEDQCLLIQTYGHASADLTGVDFTDSAALGMTRLDAAISAVPANLLDLSAGVETGKTVRQSLRLMLAALVGKLSGAATTTVAIRDTNDTKNRISATVDADGNRSAVTLDGS